MVFKSASKFNHIKQTLAIETHNYIVTKELAKYQIVGKDIKVASVEKDE